MFTSLRRSVVLGLVAVALLVGAAVAMLGVGRDDQAELERYRAAAAEAAPILAVLARYRSEHGRPPQVAEDLAGLLPEGIVADDLGDVVRLDTGAPPAWLYWPRPDGAGFEMSRKLGAEPKLVYADDNGSAQWIYDPGDGSDRRTLAIGP
jgi:hypothetical protein